jgi:phosphoglycerol transferase MdoB-like AlkP superfamily enzyme
MLWILGMFLLFMMLYRFLFFYHYKPEGRPFSGSAFLLGLRYDLRVVGIIGLSIFILTAMPFLNPFRSEVARKVWPVVLSTAFFIMLIFYVADFFHYDYLRARLNASVLNFAEDAGISARMMGESYPVFTVVIIFIGLMVTWYWLMKKMMVRALALPVSPARKYRRVNHIAFFLLMGLFIFGRVAQFPLRWSDAYRFGDEFKAATALNPFQSFMSTLKFRNSGYDAAKVRGYYPTMARYLGVPLADSITLTYKRSVGFSDTLVQKPNVVLVICESYSMYKSSMVGNPLNSSPYFDSLSRHGLFFDRCFTPATGTARGVWATITGIPDVESPKTASRNPFAVDQHSIINDFRSHSKFYFLGGNTSWANIRGVLTNNLEGIRIYEQQDFKASQEDVWGISDKNLFLESNKILAEKKEPFFAIIQTANNHRPYTIPSEDLPFFKKLSFPDDSLKKYGFNNNEELNAFRYMDFCIQQYMHAAAKEKYFNNTLFVFIGDHGIAGDAKDLLPKVYSEHSLVSEHVPLLFFYPGHVQPQRVHEVSSQLDVMPTIAGILRQPYTNTTLGKDLRDSSYEERYAFIANPDLRSVALVSNEYYFEKSKSGKTVLVPMKDGVTILPGLADSISVGMRNLAEAFYETSRYLLLNNKKPQSTNKQ